MSGAPEIRPLPQPDTAGGRPRRVGVEIEFGGLTERQVAGHAQRHFGGRIEPREGKGLCLRDSAIGDIQIYLDSQYLSEAGGKLGEGVLAVARTVVPLEIVTGPVEPGVIADLDALMADLRDAGATGTAAGLLLGFGVHFNPEVPDMEVGSILPVLCAFAFCEDALRQRMGIDIARRLLPFVDPYPRRLLDALAAEAPGDMDALAALYLEHARSRNHGLDMLSLLAHHDRATVARRVDMALVSPRPTYHYRLPDCRIDEPGWSLAEEWNRWVRIEEIAEDRGRVKELRREWRAHRAALTTMRSDWVRQTAPMLGPTA